MIPRLKQILLTEASTRRQTDNGLALRRGSVEVDLDVQDDVLQLEDRVFEDPPRVLEASAHPVCVHGIGFAGLDSIKV